MDGRPPEVVAQMPPIFIAVQTAHSPPAFGRDCQADLWGVRLCTTHGGQIPRTDPEAQNSYNPSGSPEAPTYGAGGSAHDALRK